MALAVLAGLGLYAWWRRPPPSSGIVGKDRPTSAIELPPMNRLNPAANDTIRPKAWTYDPRRIGYTDPVRAGRIFADYRQEKFLGPDGIDNPTALWKSQKSRDLYVQSQSAYWNDHVFLDNNFKAKGVAPHARINFLGNPQYYHVPPVSRSPV